MISLIGFALLVVCVKCDVPRSLRIDGDFGDWNEVPKRSDPFRLEVSDPSPLDGHPPAPDVHDTGVVGKNLKRMFVCFS